MQTLSDSIFNELQQEKIAKARKHLISIGKNPDQLDDLVDLLSLEPAKKNLESALAVLEPPVPKELLERLAPLIAHPDIGIRTSAFRIVAGTLKDQGTNFYVRCLEEPKFRDKSLPILRLYRYGNESAVPAVAKRLRQILATRKASPYLYHNGESELTHCLAYLHRFQERKEVRPAFQRMVEKWDILADREVYWVTDQLEFFNHIDLRRDRHFPPALNKQLDSNHPIFEACEQGDAVTVRKYMEEGISVYSTDTNRKLSTIALKSGHLEVLKILVAHGLDIERPVHGFDRFLILDAMHAARWDFVEYIIGQNIDLNRTSYYGSTIFGTACCGIAPPEWIKRMIDLGADVNMRDLRGESPIFSAAGGQAIGILELLLSHGSDINARNEQNQTPLIICAQGGLLESVKWLLAHGADLVHSEERGRDALYWARENNHAAIAELLIQALDQG
ncbi:MAG: ankyrin repeat domain-containing protein [Verrucomicrobiota bacterium]